MKSFSQDHLEKLVVPQLIIMMIRKLTALQKLAFVPEPAAAPATA